MQLSPRTIFVTGASGFIGPLLLKDLLEKKFDVVILLRDSGASKEERVREIFEKAKIPPAFTSNVQVVFGDITKKNLGLAQKDKEELQGNIFEVWHLAASLSFRRRDAEKNKLVNLEGTKNVVEFVDHVGAKALFYVSTLYIRGSYTGIVYEKPISRPKSFTNSYEQTKWEAEEYIFALKDRRFTIAIFRLGIVVGSENYTPDTAFGYYHFLSGILEIKNSIVKAPKIVKLLLWPLGISVRNNEVYSKIPFPCVHNKHLNLVPVHKIIYLMSHVSDHHREHPSSEVSIYNLADTKPVSLNVLFYETFHGLGMYIPIVHAHQAVLKTVFRTISLIAGILPPLKRFSRSIKYYQNYLFEEAKYDIKNISKIVGEDFFSSTLLTPKELEKVIQGFLAQISKK